MSQSDDVSPLTEILHLRTLKVENLRVFDSFRIEPRRPENGAGQWTLLLGENGVGKTTILRSLVLALSARRTADALFQLLGGSAPFLRFGSEKGYVEARLDGRTYCVHLTRDPLGVERLFRRPAT